MLQGVAARKQPLRVLIVEDSEEDADLLVLELRRAGYDPVYARVDTAPALTRSLDDGSWDVVISDYSMPSLTMPEALAIVQQKGMDLPFVIVSATIGEEAAVAAMKAGAHDYVLKHNLGRLVPAVEREMRESRLRRERRELEEQLRQSQKLESLGLLAGGVAHDFNNLLTGILGNASLALDIWNPPADAKALLEEVIRTSERAADLTRQLLAYAGKGRFVIEPVFLSNVVREISDLVRTSIPRKVQVVLNLQSDLPPIEADASQIQQLAMNLILNAAEAVGDNPGTVLVTTGVRQVDEFAIRRFYIGSEIIPGHYVYLSVRDTGCGMDENTLSHIFDPFFTTKFTGRGLGLAAAQGIVRGHGGAIRVESRVGKGSDFEVLFPAAERRARPRQHDAGAALEPLRAPDGAVVLVVDDETVVRRTARATLQRYGYGVLEAENGREAVELFERLQNRISLILLDLTMPVMDGEEAYQRLRQIRPDIPVLVSSGFDETEASRHFRGSGSVDFVQKPYTSVRLAQKVFAALQPRG